MKILMTGGTGFIGTSLASALKAAGYRITLFQTSPGADQPIIPGTSIFTADVSNPLLLQQVIEEHDCIINLAGSTIFRRWSQRVKQDIYSSRITTTKNIVEALKQCVNRHKHFFSASGIGYYGYRDDELLTEASAPGRSFLAHVAADWEAEAIKAGEHGARVLLCRLGIVLGRQGGALRNMLPFFKYWCGGRWGSGKQWFSWIHEDDLANAILFLLERHDIDGPVNLTAPNPVTNREMSRTLRVLLRKKSMLPVVPGFAMKAILGEFSSVFLQGQRVIPQRLMTQGFRFKYGLLNNCLDNLLDVSARRGGIG